MFDYILKTYCEYLAVLLIEDWNIEVWWYTFKKLVEEIEIFFESKKRKIYPNWQRNLIAFLYKKSRQARWNDL